MLVTRRIALAAVALALALTACTHARKTATSGSSAAADPAGTLRAAKDVIDKAATVHLGLTTAGQVGTLKGVDGSLKRPDGFVGTVTVTLIGATATVPVVSIGGKVYAKLPLSQSYSNIDPAKFGLSDPATLLDPAKGISTLLTATTNPKAGEQTRVNGEVTNSISGTLSAATLAAVLPITSGQGDAQVTYNLAADTNQVRRVVVKDSSGGTYTVVIDRYDQPVTITAPR